MSKPPVEPPVEQLPYRRVPPRRQRRSFAQRFAAGFRAWAHDTFSLASFLASLRSLAWVAPLTVLIWVYAEREQTAQHVPTQIRIELRNSDPNRVVQIVDVDGRSHPDQLLHVELSGPQARVEQVREKLDAGTAVQVDVDPNLPAGHNVILLNDLTRDPLFDKNGITVSNPMPVRVDIEIDPIEQVDLPVQLPPGMMNNVDGTPVFFPDKIHVSGPKSVLDAARAKGQFSAYAQVPNAQEPGAKDLPNVLVTVPFSGNPHLTIAPPTVSAKLTIKKSEVEGVVQSMPVWPIYPPGPAWDRYKVEYDINLTDVKVTGPPELIRAINDPTFEPKPKAYFEVSAADAPPPGSAPDGRRHEARITQFNFGSTGIKRTPDDPHNTITFTVVERKPAE